MGSRLDQTRVFAIQRGFGARSIHRSVSSRTGNSRLSVQYFLISSTHFSFTELTLFLFSKISRQSVPLFGYLLQYQVGGTAMR